MKKIKSNNGQSIWVDDEDFEMLSLFTWYINNQKFTSYAQAAYKNNEDKMKGLMMHRLIMNAPSGIIIDHKDGNGLNNQKSNLRFCTLSQNNMNVRKFRGTSKYKGVYWSNTNNRWVSKIKSNQKGIYLGSYSCEKKAALAYNKKAKELFGEFANINKL